MFLNWTYNKTAFVIAKEINTYWSYIVRICNNLASNILLLASKKYFLTSQGLVGAGMNLRTLNYNSLDAKQNVKKNGNLHLLKYFKYKPLHNKHTQSTKQFYS